MQKQINELGSKIVHEVERLQTENLNLKKEIDSKRDLSYSPKKVSIEFTPTSDNTNFCEAIKANLESCEQEFINTKKNCNKVKLFPILNLINIDSRDINDFS